MSTITLRAAVTAQVFLQDLPRRMEEMRERARDEDGQVSVEWVGILALVGTIVAINVLMRVVNRAKPVPAALPSPAE